MENRPLHVGLPYETYERLKLMAIMKGTSIKKIVIGLIAAAWERDHPRVLARLGRRPTPAENA
jgi:hypothetical protein